MSKTVTFGMYWEEYGQQTIPLPDDVDDKNIDEVMEYIYEQFDEIPLPAGDYVFASCELDQENIEVNEE